MPLTTDDQLPTVWRCGGGVLIDHSQINTTSNHVRCTRATNTLELVLKTFTLRRTLSPPTQEQTRAQYSVQDEAPASKQEGHCTLVMFRRPSTALSDDDVITGVESRVKAVQSTTTSWQDGKQTKRNARVVESLCQGTNVWPLTLRRSP